MIVPEKAKALKDLRVVVTGGASFIGSHLVDSIVSQGASVSVIDDLSSGKLSNLSRTLNNIKFIEGTALDRKLLYDSLRNVDIVFHLAAIHGGRGFIETYNDLMMRNLAIDNAVFETAAELHVQRIVHTSSACVYPINLQSDENSRDSLIESAANFDSESGSFPDGAYGWVKLMGEYQLKNLLDRNKAAKGRSARVFTAYGSRENESHAVVALIAKSLLKLDPFPIWGNGQQTRNFTHVSDTVQGLVHLATDSDPASYLCVNVGSSQHITIMELVAEIWHQLNWSPKKIDFQMDRPTGVKSRSADNELMRNLSGGWEPSFSLRSGISETIDWYRKYIFPNLDPNKLESRLLSR